MEAEADEKPNMKKTYHDLSSATAAAAAKSKEEYFSRPQNAILLAELDALRLSKDEFMANFQNLLRIANVALFPTHFASKTLEAKRRKEDLCFTFCTHPLSSPSPASPPLGAFLTEETKKWSRRKDV